MRLYLISLLVAAGLFGQTSQPTPLFNSYIPGITGNYIIDNRSQANRQITYASLACSGSGSWSVSLQYGTTTSSWSSYGSSATVTNASTPPVATGFLYSYPNYIRVLFNSGTPTCNFSGFKTFYPPSLANGGVTSIIAGTGIAASGSSAVTISNTGALSFNSRSGAVTPTSGDYSASQVTNAVDQTGSYSNPSWITSLAWAKLTGVPTIVNTFNGRTGAVAPTSGDYSAAQVTNAFDLTANNTLGAHSQDSTDIATPSNPASGHTKYYTKGGKICSLDPSGNENCTGAGSAPAGTGIPTVNGGAFGTTRTLQAGNGITISNGDGQAGNPTISPDASNPTFAVLSKQTAQAGTALELTETSASGTTYLFTMNPTLTSYTTDQRLNWKVVTSCTAGAITVNVDTLGGKSLKLSDGTTNPTASDCASGRTLTLAYDGTLFRIQSGGAAGGASVTKASWEQSAWVANGTGGGGIFPGGPIFWCSISGGCTPGQSSYGADPAINTADFPAGSDKTGLLTIILPTQWDAGTVKMQIAFTPSTGSGTITWNAQTRCVPNGVNPFNNTGFNSANAVTTTVTDTTFWYSQLALTMTGCSAGNILQVIVTRKGSTDTSAGAARLNQVQLSAFTTLQ